MAIGLIILIIFIRFIPHIPNFSPLIAIALFSGVYLKHKNSYLIPLVIGIGFDFIFAIRSSTYSGVHLISLFTWGSVLIIYWLGRRLQKNKTLVSIGGYTLLSSVLFFIVTNFGVWILGWYPHNLSGIIQCYYLALPFFRTSLLSSFIYAGALFGIYEYILRKKALTPVKIPTS